MRIWLDVLGVLVLAWAGYALWLYFRPPTITPLSERTLEHLARLDALEGDDE